jgi:hypothetical protein
MTRSYARYWAHIPAKADHPARVPMLEAFRWVDEPLSALDLVDLFDGEEITVWGATHHLRALHGLGVLLPYLAGRDPQAGSHAFDLPYRLAVLDSSRGRPEAPGRG